MVETVIAAACTLIGAIGLKLFDGWMSKNSAKRAKRDADQAAVEATRQETITQLRLNLNELEKKMTDLVDEVEEWKDKYWTLREEHVGRLAQLTEALQKIKEDDDDSKSAS